MTTPSTANRYAIGIDFGGTFVKLARVSADGAIEARASFATPGLDGVSGWLDAVAAQIDVLRASAAPGAEWAGVGVGVPGFVDYAKGFVHNLTNVPGWTAVPLADLLRSRFGVPAIVENDVNAMAAGECAYGAGRGLRDAVFVTLGTGVGGGILLNGSIYRGAFSMAGELGHVSIDKDGIVSPMGKGGVEQYVGNRRIVEYALSCMDAGQDGAAILRIAGGADNVTPKAISQAAAEGDPLAIHVFDHVADCLSTMMASVAYVLQPAAFIVGGGVSAAGPVLFGPLRSHLAERLSPYFLEHLEIRPAALGNDAGVIGCAALAFSDVPA
jgi:glucokinase